MSRLRGLSLALLREMEGPRFTDVHMEAAADYVLDELRAALRGDGL